MTRDVITVSPETPIFDAMELLKNNRISGMPVVDSEMRIKGMLTEKDVLRILIEDGIEYKHTVADYMTTDVVSFSENDSASQVCNFFINSHIRRVPIVHDGKLIGIVSRRDIILLILEAKSKMSKSRYT